MWEMAAASLHNVLLLDSEECHERTSNCAGSGEIAIQISCSVGCYGWAKRRSTANGAGKFVGNGKVPMSGRREKPGSQTLSLSRKREAFSVQFFWKTGEGTADVQKKTYAAHAAAEPVESMPRR